MVPVHTFGLCIGPVDGRFEPCLQEMDASGW